MAMEAAAFKPREAALATSCLVMRRFRCIRINSLANPPRRIDMIDQQIAPGRYRIHRRNLAGMAA